MALVVHLPVPAGSPAPRTRRASAPRSREASRPAHPRHLVAVPSADAAARPMAATYRRRRVAAAAVVAVSMTVGYLAVSTHARWWVTDPVAQAGTEQDGPVVARLVAPGDTLWSVAVELRPESDPRVTVDRLARLNGGAELRAGASLLVPADWIEVAR